ncbi:nicotinate phosphoribosyltransferase [Streptomyces sp. NPDC003035]|uniref:nicotinate phosphoribosyltransferase n=1 Tax=Streptomyces sp. NPDC003035 TaxID=3364676 RepID=UPI0036C8019D
MSQVTATDLREVTMALSYLREDMRAPATFSLFVRDLPPGRGFLVAAGLEPALDHLSRFRLGRSDVQEFAQALRRPAEELEPLHGLSFDGQVRAVPEGRLVLAGEPLLEVTAPLPQAQLVATSLLSLLCHQTAVATKAARCVLAARGRPLLDLSLRRSQGPAAALHAARLCAVVGFAGTGDIAAANRYGIPASGGMAHAYVQSFPSEEDAFRAYARAHPGPVTFPVDTYDTDRGVATAARVLGDLGRGPGCAIRLGGGDLDALAHRARATLDAAGLRDVRIVAGGGLDEYAVAALVRDGAPIDVFAMDAMDANAGGAGDAPYLDATYELVEYDGRPVMRLSSTTVKATAPAPKQIFRGPDLRDVIGLANEEPPEGTEPLLRTMMRGGLRTEPPDTLDAARARFEADVAELPQSARRVEDPVAPVPVVSTRLAALTTIVRHRLQARTPSGT